MGSLFKLRDYWYTRFSGEEFSNTHSLTVGNVDNQANGENKIIFGSFAGLLRIMQPTKKGAASPGDLILEKDFGEPVLQVACRPFESCSEGRAANLLAVLFPTRLAFLCVKREGCESSVKDSSSVLQTLHTMHLCYETQLCSSAYNFICGPFGRSKHELVCVQSMDGQLTIIDRNVVLFRCFLPAKEFLLPGCLSYCPYRDSFITCSSAMNILCYLFSALASNQPQVEVRQEATSETQAEDQEVDLTPTWSYPLGEDAVAMEVCRFTRGLPEDDADIIVLCPYALVVLTLNGNVRQSKRLDVAGVCLTSYDVPDAGASNILIGTAMGSILVFSDATLEWSAKMAEGVPVCLEVARFLSVPGLIVTLSTEGVVALNYLGTDPEEDPIQPLESREVNYDDAVKELRQVQQSIKRITNPEEDVKKTKETDKVLEVSWEIATEVGCNTAELDVLLKIHNCNEDVTALQVSACVSVTIPVEVETPRYTIGSIGPGDTAHVSLRFRRGRNPDSVIPSSLDAPLVITYNTRCTTGNNVGTVVKLPFTLIAWPIPFVNVAKFVLQFDTDKSEPPSLTEVFTDLSQNEHISSNLLAIQYVNGAQAVLFVSRNAGRFRVQASAMEALWLFTNELRTKLLTFYDSKVQFTIPDPLPMENYFSVIGEHMELRKELHNANTALARASQMFLTAQKRLLALLRANGPTSVALASTLLEGCYDTLQRCTNTVCHLTSKRRRVAAALCCCSRLVVMELLIKCQETLTNPDDIYLIESIFTCNVDSESDLGWEETIGAALDLLPPGNRSGGNGALVDLSGDGSTFVVTDMGRLKKQISEFFDKLLGGSLKVLL